MSAGGHGGNQGRRRWIWSFVFLFAAHVALVFWLGERTQPRAFASKPQPFLHIAADDPARLRVAAIAAAADPTLFALPNMRGFSAAWLNFTPAPLIQSNWSDPPRWLPMPADGFGASLAQFTSTNGVPTGELLDKLRQTPAFAVPVPAQPVSTGSTFHAIGSLAARRIRASIEVPTITNADLVTNTVIHVSVNGQGEVESAVLVEACGLKSADEQAVKLARRIEFEPLPVPARERDMAPPVRGRLVFRWHVIAPAGTNTLTAVAP